MKLILLYRRRWGLFYLPVLVLAALAIYWAATRALPLPPRQLTLAAGVPQGGYAQLARRYRDELGRRGIAVDIVTSDSGAEGALQRLNDANDPAQAGFAHGLLSHLAGPGVEALAVVGKQPLWIFTRVAGVNSVAQLRGLKIAAGAPGAPVRYALGLALAQAQVREGDIQWDARQGLAAANDLRDGRLDAMVLIGSGDSPTARMLSRTPGMQMLGIERATALAAREPRLHAFVLPQGTIELRGDVPPRDLTLLYTGTHLLVRSGMHPALQRALLDAAAEIHSVPAFLQGRGEYPDTHSVDYPLSPQAQRHALGYRPGLEGALPYWWAELAELLLFAVLPVMLGTVALLAWIPRLFNWRVNAVLAHHYGELKFLEHDLETVAVEQPIALRNLLTRIDEMEQQVARLDLPDSYADRWYTLREHLSQARARLLSLRSR